MAFKCFDPEIHKVYPAFTLYPFFHKLEKMPWASAAVVRLEDCENLIFASGQTGRDPETDRQPRNFDEERARVGVVFEGIKAQTKGSWMRIKEILEGMGSCLEDIIFVRQYLANRNDWWEMREATKEFFLEHAPDLWENRRAGTLLKDIKLDLPEMLVEIEVIAAQPKKR